MYLKIQNKRFTSFKYVKKFKMKRSQFWAFEKNQNQRTISSYYFENLKELMDFMKELAKCWPFSMQLFDFFKNMKTMEIYIEIRYLILR